MNENRAKHFYVHAFENGANNKLNATNELYVRWDVAISFHFVTVYVYQLKI